MKIFSFDAESNGLWGHAFAVAAIVYQDSHELARFIGRCPMIEDKVDPWVQTFVLPQMTGIAVSHNDYDLFLTDFTKFYMEHKGGADIIAHMAVPVEAGLLQDMHHTGLMGDMDGPYPLIDLAGCLKQVGEDPTSVDTYAEKYGVSVYPAEYGGGTHNPLYDAAQEAAVYRHLMSRVPR